MRNAAHAFAQRWREACNSHDLNRILALYSDAIVFKSPRVRTLFGVQDGTLHGKEAVRIYWEELLERRPDLAFAVERVFAGTNTIALEYRVGDLCGIEFMILDADGLVSFAAGNDLA